jgi:FtsH-binding integral membrane protein
MMAIALLLTLTLGAIAVLHGYWTAGGLWPGGSKAELAAIVVGRPRMSDMPSPGLSVVVTLLLTGAAAWPFLLSPLAVRYLGQPIAVAGGLLAAAVFLLRGVAGYSAAMTRRHSAEPFATYNRLYYSPLCLAIGAGFLVLALNGETA